MVRSPFGRLIFPPLALAALILIAFAPVFRNDFVQYDDIHEIVSNPDLNPVSFSKLSWNWTHTRLSLYMPVTYYVWGAVAAVAPRVAPSNQLSATPFHAFNLLLHILCAILIYQLILQWWKRPWPAFAGALVFGLHPLQVEAVAWASGMYTLLSCALCLTVLLIHCRPTQPSPLDPPPSVGRWTLGVGRWTFALTSALYLTALLTKPASISLPLIVATIDLLILARPFRQTALIAALWIMLGIPVIVLVKHFQDVSSIADHPLWFRPIIALDAIGFYLRKILLPIHLIPDYGRTPGWVLRNGPLMILSVVTAICLLLCAWLARKRLRWLTASILILLAGTLPYLGLTTFDFQYISTVADRYAYMGMIGTSVFVAGIVLRSRLATAGLLILAGIWIVLTHAQTQRWQNSDTLFAYTLSENPDSLLSHAVRGYLAAHQNPPDLLSAEADYKAALKVWPQDAEVLYNLGNLYLRQNPELAMMQYQQAVANRPHEPEYRNNLAIALARLGQNNQAYDQWQQAITLAPDYVDARNNRGDFCRRMNRPQAAIADYQAVLQIDPNNQHAAAMLKQMSHPQ